MLHPQKSKIFGRRRLPLLSRGESEQEDNMATIAKKKLEGTVDLSVVTRSYSE